MKVNWKAGLVTAITALFTAACGYIGGHTSAMHQHASIIEQNRMLLNERDEIDIRHYVIEAFKDYKRMQDDPCGLKRREELN